jgi:hypothetical protein
MACIDTRHGEVAMEILRYTLCAAQRFVLRYWINSLTPELNPSAQRCLPRLFTGDFNF